MAARRPSCAPRSRPSSKVSSAGSARDGCCTPPPGPLPLAPALAASTVPALKALAEPARLAILRRLASADGSVCACDLGTGLGVGQPTVSHHLAVLKRAGLVTSTTRGRWAYYRIAPGTLAGVLEDLGRLAPERAASRTRRAKGRA